jgi:hypothetical protein
VRLDTRISDIATMVRTCVPFFSVAIYKHCVRAGQAKCGWNGALRSPNIFKQAFEIGGTGKTAKLYLF